MVGFQPNFFIQLSIHRLFGSLVRIDAPLGKLPRILSDAFRPEQLALLIAQNNTDIWPETVRIYHDQRVY